jgi:hypothetical protein
MSIIDHMGVMGEPSWKPILSSHRPLVEPTAICGMDSIGMTRSLFEGTVVDFKKMDAAWGGDIRANIGFSIN